MNPIVDQLLVGALIVAAMAFFVIRALLRRKGCCGDCGCAASKLRKAFGKDDLGSEPKSQETKEQP